MKWSTIKMARPLRIIGRAQAGEEQDGRGGKRLVCEFAWYCAYIWVRTFNARQRRTHVGTF